MARVAVALERNNRSGLGLLLLPKCPDLAAEPQGRRMAIHSAAPELRAPQTNLLAEREPLVLMRREAEDHVVPGDLEPKGSHLILPEAKGQAGQSLQIQEVILQIEIKSTRPAAAPITIWAEPAEAISRVQSGCPIKMACPSA